MRLLSLFFFHFIRKLEIILLRVVGIRIRLFLLRLLFVLLEQNKAAYTHCCKEQQGQKRGQIAAALVFTDCRSLCRLRLGRLGGSRFCGFLGFGIVLQLIFVQQTEQIRFINLV